MAKALTLALPLPLPLPLPQSHKLNQFLLHTHSNRNTISSSCTRIFSSNSHKNTNHINTPNIKNNNNNVNCVHNRRFTSISVTPFPPLSYSYLPFCSSCNRHCFPSFALLSLRRSRFSSLWFVTMSHNGEHASTNPHNSTKTIKCIIKGRVQGVFYRNWTIDNATELGLKGWVRNRRDGSVEALFSGNARAVDEMLQRCRRGPPHAMVTALDSSPSDEDPGAGFERKPTV